MSTSRIEPPSAETLVEARRAIEAMLLVATDPTPDQLLAQLVELPSDLVGAMCRELAQEYENQERGFQLVEIAGGWRFQTHPDVHPYVERYALEGIPNRLSNAALETLAIVAYKQPISRGQISAIRGVNVDAVLKTLVQRGYVDEHGKDDGPGQASLFGTTDFFLEQLGLMSTDDLPALGEFVPSAEVLEALEQTLKIGVDEVEAEVEAEVAEDDDGDGQTEPEAEDSVGAGDEIDLTADNGDTPGEATGADELEVETEPQADGENHGATNGEAPPDS
jgi:segregation and condensation protein B